MAVTKLSADAPPYLSPNRLQLSPPLPHPPPPLHMAMSAAQYHAATLPFPAVVATYPYGAPFFLAAPRPVVHGFTRPPPPARFLLKPAAVNNPFLSPLPPPLCSSESIPSPTSTLLPLGGTALSSSPSPPTSPPVRALSPEAAPFVPLPSDPFVPPPFGSAPHKLISLAGAGGVEAEKKLQAEGAEAAAAAAAGAKPAKPPRRGITKGPRRRRQAAEPAPVVPRAAKPARSPPPLFTTRPQTPVPAPEWRDNQELTTLMIRNIPNRLTPGELMLLLDDHCARANKKERGGGATLAAYDFLYLRMDFSRMGSSNMGYAFVNLTTAEAAQGLQHALRGARWTVFASKKVIDICPARIQGKEALVRHFSRARFACSTAAFLPAFFSPPRDGAAAGAPSAVTCYVGSLVAPFLPPRPRPRPAAARPDRGTTWKPKPKPIRIVQKEEEEPSMAASSV